MCIQCDANAIELVRILGRHLGDMMEPSRYTTFERDKAMGKVGEESIGFVSLDFPVLDGDTV